MSWDFILRDPPENMAAGCLSVYSFLILVRPVAATDATFSVFFGCHIDLVTVRLFDC
jgi:hypothetical protein